MRTTELSYASLEVNKLEAFLEVMFLAAHADGEIHETERVAFREQVARETHGQLEPALVDMMLGQIEKNLSKQSREARIASICARLPEQRLRRAALEIAARIICADGKVVADEVVFFESSALSLDVDLGDAKSILERAIVEQGSTIG